MSKPFLQQVCEHYFPSQGYCFIFPNRRALVFFRKYFAQSVSKGKTPVICPKLCTINDFFYTVAGANPTDKVHLLLLLYKSYCELNPAHESLDEFIQWGEIMLSDFNDIDKYLIAPEKIFANISEFKALQGDYSFLDETQKAALERFLHHFDTPGRYKDEFRRIWDILLPLYLSFNKNLLSQGLSYEGSVYRQLAQTLQNSSVVDLLSKPFPNTDKFVFVGLNALNECEKLIMRKMRDAKIAEFCWDYSSDWIKDSHNKSSLFLSENIIAFPQAFQLDPQGLTPPKFHILSLPSSIGQTKQLASILDRVGAKGIETAIVLPDETMLLPVLNAIPQSLQDINVTMGYPLRSGSLWTLISDISAMQLQLRNKDGKWYFYYHKLINVLSNSIFKCIATEEDMELEKKIRAERRYYIASDELNSSPLFAKIFQIIITKPNEADEQQILRLQNYFCDMISFIATELKGKEDMELEIDFAKQYYLSISRLSSYNLEVLPSTWFRLLNNLVGRSSVPFQGEPLKGLQIMGPLETRALDFDNIIILNANEGIFPRRANSSSFVPPELRKGFGLPGYEYQDAVWAYYFYRCIQRAKNVWILSDSRTDGLKGGEESRYIKQLEMHFGADITRYEALSPIDRHNDNAEIPKTEADIAELKTKYLSASSLQKYICCPAQFYYSKVKGLDKEKELKESLDASMIGKVFHSTMQELYSVPGGILTMKYLNSLRNPEKIKPVVEKHILSELKCFEISGRNLLYEDMIYRYVRQCILQDIKLMTTNNIAHIKIIGLEQILYDKICGFNFIGFVDRLDSLVENELRIVDYKTGRVNEDNFKMDDSNAEKVIGKLFGKTKYSQKPLIVLQLYLYDRFVSQKYPNQLRSNSIYQVSRLFIQMAESVRLSQKFSLLMEENLTRVLNEIADTSVPFSRTDDPETCKYCDFKTICGR